MPKRGPAPHSVHLAKDIENHVLDVFQSHPAEMAGALILTSSLRHFSNKTAAVKYHGSKEKKENAFLQWLGERRDSDHLPKLVWIQLKGMGRGWAVAPKPAAGTVPEEKTLLFRFEEGSEDNPPGTFKPIQGERKRQQKQKQQEKQKQLKRQQQGQGQQQGQQGEQHQQHQHQQQNHHHPRRPLLQQHQQQQQQHLNLLFV